MVSSCCRLGVCPVPEESLSTVSAWSVVERITSKGESGAVAAPQDNTYPRRQTLRRKRGVITPAQGGVLLIVGFSFWREHRAASPALEEERGCHSLKTAEVLCERRTKKRQARKTEAPRDATDATDAQWHLLARLPP